MQLLKAGVTKLLKEHGKTRSTRNLQFDIPNLREQYKSLKHFKASFGWIRKMKRKVLKPTPNSIEKEVDTAKLLEWLKKRNKNPLTSLVTTDQVRANSKSIWKQAVKIRSEDVQGMQRNSS